MTPKIHMDLTYHIIVGDLIYLAPGVHDPSIVVCNESNHVNALIGKLLAVLDIWRKVEGLAAGGESTFQELASVQYCLLSQLLLYTWNAN